MLAIDEKNDQVKATADKYIQSFNYLIKIDLQYKYLIILPAFLDC